MHRFALCFLVTLATCKSEGEVGGEAAPEATAPAKEAAERDPMVGYDVRRLRPREEPLVESFERQRERALSEGKQVAVLFSADWCEPCRILELELGNMHPRSLIGHVRILEMKEEDWEPVTRMNEFNNLRRRWSAPLNEYPLFMLLDEDGEKVEEMQEAKRRLEGMGVEPTLFNWFESRRRS